MGIRNYLCGITLIFVMYSCKPVTIEQRDNLQICDFDRIRHFTYKGYKYISFEQNPNMSHATLAVVHDPNCPCHENSN